MSNEVKNTMDADLPFAPLDETKFNLALMRPWLADDGKGYVTRENGENVEVPNGVLKKDEWAAIDASTVRWFDNRTREIQDFVNRGLHYTQDLTDKVLLPDEGKLKGKRFVLQNIPLPFIHKDFFLVRERIEKFRLPEYRKARAPFGPDLTVVEAAARRVGDGATQMIMGLIEPFKYGDQTLYGICNHPARTRLPLPEMNPKSVVDCVYRMRDALRSMTYYGPYKLYYSSDYNQLMDEDWPDCEKDGCITPRRRIKRDGAIGDVTLLGGLRGLVLVQLQSDTLRVIRGCPPTVVQTGYDEKNIYLKVLTIHVPQIRTDVVGKVGIVHAGANDA